uniref:Succinate dehydrogenase [ubiquinone] cytochrome b small subunit n=1 Tax=Lygus hesperus TaxID=30085 RepID=A0A0A9WBT3_LYGHE
MLAACIFSRTSCSFLTRGNYLLRGRFIWTATAAQHPKWGRTLTDKFGPNAAFNNATKQNGILAVSTSAFLENALTIKKAKSKKKKGGECPAEEGGDKKKHGHIPHGQLWFIEKIISVMLIPVVPLAIFYPNPLFDLILIFTLMAHMHWGIVATVIDYVRPIIVGDMGAKIAYYACYGISIFICLGLLNLAIRGPGIGNSFQTLWSM